MLNNNVLNTIMKLTYLGSDIFNIIKEYIDNYDKLNYINKATKLLKLNDYTLSKTYSVAYLYDINYYTYVNSIIQNTYNQLSLQIYNIYKCNFKSKLNVNNLFIYNCKNFCLNAIARCKSLSMWCTHIHISNSDSVVCDTNIYIYKCYNLITLSQFKTVKLTIESCVKITSIKNNTISELIVQKCGVLKEIYVDNIKYLTVKNNLFLEKLVIDNKKIIKLEIENCNLLSINNINEYSNLEYLTINSYTNMIDITNLNLPNLKSLYITSYNTITKINCINLKKLLIHNNSSLDTITNNSLKVLELCYCNIKYINCNNLEYLSLSYCDKIKKIINEKLLFMSIYELDSIIAIECRNLNSIDINKCILANLLLEKVENITLDDSFIELLYVPNLKNRTINDITDESFINYIVDIINESAFINIISLSNIYSITKPIKIDKLESLSIVNSEILSTININKIEYVYLAYITFTEYMYNCLRFANITNLYINDLCLTDEQTFKIINLHTIKNITIDNTKIK